MWWHLSLMFTRVQFVLSLLGALLWSHIWLFMPLWEPDIHVRPRVAYDGLRGLSFAGAPVVLLRLLLIMFQMDPFSSSGIIHVSSDRCGCMYYWFMYTLMGGCKWCEPYVFFTLLFIRGVLQLSRPKDVAH